MEGDQETVKEFVKVVNIEVPMRVFFKGKPVENLEKNDFTLYEGKKLQKIHGFYIVKKRIKTQRLDFESERKESLKKRYFVLMFQITDYTRELKKSLRYIFNNILKKKDKVLVFINDKTVSLNNLSDMGKAHSIIERFLKEQSLTAKIRLYKWINKFENMFKFHVSISDAESAIQFFQRYLLMWKEYKKKYLIPDLDTYYNFARYLEKINMEKWVINFYQIEMFPQLKPFAKLKLDGLIGELQSKNAEYVNMARMISRYIVEIEKELKVADDFPSVEISKIFLKANTTFHSVFFRTYREMMPDIPMELNRVSTDTENSLREITRKTGGELIVSNRITLALNKIVEKEDILYMLTYLPEDNGKRGKIRVEVKNKDYRIYYDDNIRSDYLREYLERKKVNMSLVKIKKTKFEEKTLSIVITDFFMEKEKGNFRGKISVNIQIKKPDSEILLEENKIILAKKNIVSISLSFNWLKQGEYNIIVNVKDQLSDKTAIDFLKAKVD